MASIDTITKLVVSLSNDQFLLSVKGASRFTHNGSGGVKSGSALHGSEGF